MVLESSPRKIHDLGEDGFAVFDNRRNMTEDALPNLPVLSDAECRRAEETVIALRDHWIQRVPELPFYTLGAASYLDAVKPGYVELAEKTNPILTAELGWLLDRVRAFLADRLGAHVRVRERAALPGLHVFLAHPAFRRPLGSIHRDLQFEHLDWTGFDAPDFEHPLSFTLAVTLPKHGGGLNRWLPDPKEPPRQRAITRLDLTEGLTKTYHPYQRGSIVIHSGFDVHQIAPANELTPDDQRITLQGHGIRAGGSWWLYW